MSGFGFCFRKKGERKVFGCKSGSIRNTPVGESEELHDHFFVKSDILYVGNESISNKKARIIAGLSPLITDPAVFPRVAEISLVGSIYACGNQKRLAWLDRIFFLFDLQNTGAV